jgi:hypothetical protein
LLVDLVRLITLLAAIEFARILLRLRRSRWIVGYEATLVVLAAASSLESILHTGTPHSTAFLVTRQIGTIVLVAPVDLLLPLFALWIWRRSNNTDALLLAVPLLIRTFFIYSELSLLLLSVVAHHPVHIPNVPVPTFDIGWTEIGDFLFLAALLIFLIIRTVRLARSRAVLASEIEAARTVQQLLLARSAQPTPGFAVHSVYLPASEVGGDFFLVSPHPDPGNRSLVALVGDVSGKGLLAAMRVSMILGVLRRESSRNPAVILANLNDALVTQDREEQGPSLGFTTAVCIHLEEDGSFTAANAGHIAPYQADNTSSHELATPPALPLGLAPDQAYELLHGALAPGQRLVLLSDGIPEARAKNGQLYGFDRLPHLTQLSAQDIAEAAQRFGQEDDITVLTLGVA